MRFADYFYWLRSFKNEVRSYLLQKQLTERTKEHVNQEYSKSGLRDLKFYFDQDVKRKMMVDGKITTDHPSTVRDYHLSLIEDEIRSSGAQRVLEIGAGTSINIYLLQQLLPSVDFTGIDLVENRIKTGKKFFKEKYNFSPNSYVGDATKLDFADNSFEVVYSMYCFEQMNRVLDDALSEAVRVCKNRLVLIEPDWKYSNPAQKMFLKKHDYLRNFDAALTHLPGKLRHHKLETYFNPMVRAGLFIVELS